MILLPLLELDRSCKYRARTLHLCIVVLQYHVLYLNSATAALLRCMFFLFKSLLAFQQMSEYRCHNCAMWCFGRQSFEVRSMILKSGLAFYRVSEKLAKSAFVYCVTSFVICGVWCNVCQTTFLVRSCRPHTIGLTCVLGLAVWFCSFVVLFLGMFFWDKCCNDAHHGT